MKGEWEKAMKSFYLFAQQRDFGKEFKEFAEDTVSRFSHQENATEHDKKEGTNNESSASGSDGPDGTENFVPKGATSISENEDDA